MTVPSGCEDSCLDKIFEYKLPKLKKGENQSYIFLISAEIITPFKNFNAVPRGQIHWKFYEDHNSRFR
jgi:hypothetical protein